MRYASGHQSSLLARPPHTAHLVASAIPEQLRNTATQVPGSEDLRLCPGRVEPGKVDCGGPLAVTVGRVLMAGVIACCACMPLGQGVSNVWRQSY